MFYHCEAQICQLLRLFCALGWRIFVYRKLAFCLFCRYLSSLKTSFLVMCGSHCWFLVNLCASLCFTWFFSDIIYISTYLKILYFTVYYFHLFFSHFYFLLCYLHHTSILSFFCTSCISMGFLSTDFLLLSNHLIIRMCIAAIVRHFCFCLTLLL